MIDGLSFFNSKFLWPVVLGLVILWAIFIWKEWSQRKEKRFWIKGVVSLIGLFCLGMVILKPALPKDQAEGMGIVLTDGYRQTQLDSLKSKYKRIPVQQYVPGQALNITAKVDSLFLLGHGLLDFDFWQIQGKAVTFLGADDKQGWSDIQHDKHIFLGETLKVRANYHQPEKDHWAVLLDHTGNPLDSVLFDEGPNSRVSITTSPKASGRFVYSLVEKDENGEMVSEEPIPVVIEETLPLKILIINDFPTFETKYLKNFLAEKGHEVSVRSQLTRNKYKFEYFNGASNPIYQFSQQGLEDYDLLIIDADSYFNLNNTSKSALDKSITEDGLGLFVQPNASFFISSKQAFLSFEADYSEKLVLGESLGSMEKYPYGFAEVFPSRTILMDSVPVAAYVMKGKGKIATTNLKNSYQLLLDGKNQVYTRIWTTILDEIVREREKVAEWESLTEVPHIDEPFQFNLRTRLETPQVYNEEALIPLRQDLQVSSNWQGTTYPRNTGWNQLQIQKDSMAPFSYYVFKAEERNAVSQKKRMMSNIREFGRNQNTLGRDSAMSKIFQVIPPIWFYVVFVLCMGWLWLEPKLFGQ